MQVQSTKERILGFLEQLCKLRNIINKRTLLESKRNHRLDWIEQCFTSPPTKYRLYGRRLLQVKRPNEQYQSTEGTYSTQRNQTDIIRQ